MICPICNDTEVIKAYDPNQVKFICKNGHMWYENYTDKGGDHRRPTSYEVKMEDIFFPSERVVYNRILKEIESNMSFYNNADPVKKLEALVVGCNVSKEVLLELLKKVASFNSNKGKKK